MKDSFAQEIAKVEEAIKGREFENVFFVACGGSMAALMPGQYFFDKEINIPSYVYNAGEFNTKKPAALGEKSLVITRSHSGNTPETVEATKYARSKGAMTIAISMLADSELCQAAEYIITYDYGPSFGPEIKAVDGDYAAFWRLFFKIAYALSGNEKYQRGYDSIGKLQEAFDINIKNTKETAFKFGSDLKREKIIYTIASGEYYSIAYSYSSCLLMEMLWINSNPIHAGEHFHGPFEIVDYDVPFLIIRGIGSTRPLDDRAINFTKKFSDKVYVLDVADLDLSMFDEDLKEYFAVPVTSTVIRQYADGLAEHTGHPLSVRRYMWKMEY